MTGAGQPRRPGDPIPEDLNEIELEIDYWTDQLAECSGGSEGAYRVETRLKRLDRAKRRAPSKTSIPQDANATRGPRANTRTAGEQKTRVFISHSHRDSAVAEAFADLFHSAFNLPCEEIRCSSVPRYSLPFGAEVRRHLKEEVLAASVVIGIVTQSSRESAWVLFELGARWGASKPLIPVLAPNGDAGLLPPPIRDAHAMICGYDNIIKLVEEVAPLLGESMPRTSTFTNYITAIMKAAPPRISARIGPIGSYGVTVR